jgi:MED6 mediator sub complex component
MLVLFYFAQSPFFDRQSNNNSVFLQATSDPRFIGWLATRENFEAQLRRIAGTEYVVIHDPIALKVHYANGEPSNIWVIQKQIRRKRPGQEDEITPLSVYYIVGDAIYQAPTIAKLIGNRMVGPRLDNRSQPLMMKVIDSDFFKQTAVNSSSFASLFSSIRTHLPYAVAEACSS